jgi:hypothetical protein
MKETIELGSAPADEECAQVGSEGYYERGKHECNVYKNMLYRWLRQSYNEEDLPMIRVKSHVHDYGCYLELIVVYDDTNEVQAEAAWALQNDSPTEWDEIAKQELAIGPHCVIIKV